MNTVTGKIVTTVSLNYLYIICLVISLVLLQGCANLPVGHGYVELDENTDPMFIKPDTADTIGYLEPTGDNVFLNNRTVTTRVDIVNHDSIRTGPKSWAKIRFRGVFSDKCPRGIGIHEFRQGRLLGSSDTCAHDLLTTNAHVVSEQDEPLYHINTRSRFTELTMIRGTALIEPLGNPALKVIVRERHEAVIEGSSVSGPRRLTDREIRERIKWARAEVPDLVTLTERDARRSISAAGLNVGRVSQVAGTDKRKTGTVQRQNPPPGRLVETETRIDLWIWGTPEVPGVVNRTESEARRRITDAGLGIGRITTVANRDAGRAGTVQRQNPAPGTTVEHGTRVDLWIRDKPVAIEPATPIRTVSSPQLIGKTQREAVNILERLGMKVGRITPLNSIPGDASIVRKQSPTANQQVPAGTTFQLWTEGVLY